MSFGISPKSMELIINALMQKNEIDKACIFGSRSMGNHKNGSDVDLAIYGIYITDEILNQINIELNGKLPLPYYFDVVHYESLKHEGLKEHIERFGKVFYIKHEKVN
ncbi:MAG: DNA polymerase III subunit beta [Peptococcaceae bacterium BICA1-8]|nr:MAG: DNA polymerase III subunit beta [Peptococcaceae bacterium BICA1-8]